MFIYSFSLLILLIKKNAHKKNGTRVSQTEALLVEESDYESWQTLKLNTTVL